MPTPNDTHLQAHEARMAALKAEFNANPRAYAMKYGTINSVESSMLVLWLLERIDRLEGRVSQ